MIFTNNFNELILQEAGLETDANNNVVDQDTGAKIEFSGHPMKYSADEMLNKGDVVFDPLNNIKQMQSIFKYSIDKMQNDTDTYVQAFFTKNITPEKTVLALKQKDNSVPHAEFKEIQSKSYNNESLKYADVLLQVNGDTNVDLSSFDTAETSYDKKHK